ncbi:RNA-binding cell elongation regulator Jag/EloR [Latilactobacillus graminis]|uniref:RNA-binding protein KhpB n=2 Tax=Latilactobacillus graminis TaxID=60519 RepID=A0AA89L5B3_9LACO|nr:RNA-binding cell elongation regulator Jag/EloR [Latilactobacillus graminis]KRM24301.1 R3H domain protein [Latilactobacillus graminis DSM 20719]QFP80299.1 protein jag [Latilactobacillus graminis]
MPTYEGSDMQAAIAEGLRAMHLTRDEVTIDVLEAGKKGFLGFGRRAALVRLTPNEQVAPTKQPTQVHSTQAPKTKEAPVSGSAKQESEVAITAKLIAYLTAITTQIGTPVRIQVTHDHRSSTYHLKTDKQGLLIGKHGKTINALQDLAQTYYDHHMKGKQTIILEVGDYRQRRAAIVNHLADKAAREVVATGKPVFLEPMPAFERKIVHGHLAANRHVKTHSEGQGNRRAVVVEPGRIF